jgi:hypothetical protein
MRATDHWKQLITNGIHIIARNLKSVVQILVSEARIA